MANVKIQTPLESMKRLMWSEIAFYQNLFIQLLGPWRNQCICWLFKFKCYIYIFSSKKKRSSDIVLTT